MMQKAWPQFEFTDGYEMMHKAWYSIEEVSYCFSRSPIKTGKITWAENQQF